MSSRRAHRWLQAPAVLWATSLAAMCVGLAIDTRTIAPEALVSRCTATTSAWAHAVVDWQLMPASHGLMLAVALAATLAGEFRRREAVGRRVPRLCRSMACLCGMTTGMTMGEEFAPALLAAGMGTPFAALAGASAAGMAAGMLAMLPLHLNGWRRPARLHVVGRDGRGV